MPDGLDFGDVLTASDSLLTSDFASSIDAKNALSSIDKEDSSNDNAKAVVGEAYLNFKKFLEESSKGRMEQVNATMTQQRASDGRNVWVSTSNIDAFLAADKLKDTDEAVGEGGGNDKQLPSPPPTPPPAQFTNNNDSILLKSEIAALKVASEKDAQMILFLQEDKKRDSKIIEQHSRTIELHARTIELHARTIESLVESRSGVVEESKMSRERLSSYDSHKAAAAATGGGGRGRGGRGGRGPPRGPPGGGRGGNSTSRLSAIDLEAAASNFEALQSSFEEDVE